MVQSVSLNKIQIFFISKFHRPLHIFDQCLFSAWGPETIKNAKAMYDQSKTWTDELVANVTGPQTDTLIKRVQTGQEHAEKKMVEMELMLKRYKAGEPIFDFEGSLKNDTFKPVDIKERIQFYFNRYIRNIADISGALLTLSLSMIILNSHYGEGTRDVNNMRVTIVTYVLDTLLVMVLS